MKLPFHQKQDREKETDKQIASDLKTQHKQDAKTIKMLLLGAGQSGKSTVLKQMRVLHTSGFSLDERMMFVGTLHTNVLDGMRELVQGAKKLDIPLDEDIEQDAHSLLQLSTGTLSKETCLSLHKMWQSPSIQEVWQRRSEIHGNDVMAYYLNSLDRFAEEEFIPTDADILHARAETRNITSIDFSVDGINFRLFDVGGQRSERRKWIHCFDDVTAVLFVAAISEYDQVVEEENSMNRLKESMVLFSGICNSPHFERSSMILFLNKRDLFEEKIPRSPLSKTFPEYKGGAEVKDAIAFVSGKFLALNESGRMVFVHVTSATDTNNIGLVFNDVRDTILGNNLVDSGF